jgi:hypothetical protein
MAGLYKLIKDNIGLNPDIKFDLIEFRELVESIILYIATVKGQVKQDLN